MKFAEREHDNVEVEVEVEAESGRGALDFLAVPELLDGLRSVLKERGLLGHGAPALDRLQEALGERYRIVGELGRGGNAVVYLAYETELQRPVALKVLLASRSGPDAQRDKLLREARTAAQLSHPNIVPIHAVEQAGEFVFFTMEYVEGETLAQLVSDGGPLPVGEATRILHDVARAVGYAHARGVVHRDLKPDNIMIETESGRVMVMDFGIALAQAQPDIGAAGYVLGTAPFISPEQVRGDEGDERSDVYALGITAYYAVTGELPFYSDTTQEIFRQHVSQHAPLLEVLGQNLDVTYSDAVRRCLAKNPDRRFASGADLADWLATAPELRRGDLPVPVRAFVERLNRLTESSRGVSLLASGGLFGLVAGLFSASWTVTAWSAGLLGVIGTSAAITLLRSARRVFRAGYTRADIIHALSVDLEREQQVTVFARGKLAPWHARIARPAAYGGLGLAAVGTALTFVPGLDPVVGFSAMLAGFVVALASSVMGAAHTRKRRDLPRAWWLSFWKSRLGGWVARVARFGLGKTGSGEQGAG